MYTYIYTTAYTYDYIRLHLIKNCLCCFLDIHLCSNNLSTTATISLLILSKLFPACFLEVIVLIYHTIRLDQMIKNC